MSGNGKLGLPRTAMREILIAFDIDGTLRSNRTETSMEVNTYIFKGGHMFPEIAPQQQPEEVYYWRLTTKDGREVLIPPSAVAVVRRRLEARETINTTSITVPFSEVKSFEKTARKAVDIPLLEEAARAFNEPVIVELDDGTQAVKARWVKKQVTPNEWSSYYSKGSYKRLDEEDGFVWVAFVVAAHQVDTDRVSYCTEEEIRKLTK